MIRLVAATYVVLAAHACQSAQRTDDSSIVFTGDGWAVALHEPPGWHAHCCSGQTWGANVVLYRDSLSLARGSDLIRIVIAKKTDENTEADLQADMEAYRGQYADVRFDSLTIAHPRYRVLSRVFTVPGRFYEYVSYLNPGPSSQHVLSVAFNKQGAPATTEELAAYRQTVASLVVLR